MQWQKNLFLGLALGYPFIEADHTAEVFLGTPTPASRPTDYSGVHTHDERPADVIFPENLPAASGYQPAPFHHLGY